MRTHFTIKLVRLVAVSESGHCLLSWTKQYKESLKMVSPSRALAAGMTTCFPFDSGDASIRPWIIWPSCQPAFQADNLASLQSQSGASLFLFCPLVSLFFSYRVLSGWLKKNLRRKKKIKMGLVLQLSATSLWRWVI